MRKCVFIDRDGVINVDCVDYTYKVEDFKLINGVAEGLKLLKKNGFLLIVITNQSGIAKGIYGHEDVRLCHTYLQGQTGNLIDAFYYSPYHESYSASLSRKPGTLMFERAIAKFNIDPKQSFMLGDKERDLLPAKKLHIKTILLPEDGLATPSSDFVKKDLWEAARFIVAAKI